MKGAILHPEAERELAEAAAYYQFCSQGLGRDFSERVAAAIRSVQEQPSIGTHITTRIRRRLVTRFPYAVLYRNEPDTIVVVAVAHLSRRPGYWKDRL